MARRYVLDTHVLIWFQEDNPRIPKQAKQVIAKLPELYASITGIHSQAINDGFTFLTIANEHLYRYNSIPLNDSHRDPFDRLLIATAIEEDAIMLSADANFGLYPNLLTLFWE